jgi:serine/threonine protein kinase
MDTFCGSLDFLAPEMVKIHKTPLKQGYGKEIDIWAIGIIAYALMSAEFPFSDANDKDKFVIMRRILDDGIYFSKVWSTKSKLGIFWNYKITE